MKRPVVMMLVQRMVFLSALLLVAPPLTFAQANQPSDHHRVTLKELREQMRNSTPATNLPPKVRYSEEESSSWRHLGIAEYDLRTGEETIHYERSDPAPSSSGPQSLRPQPPVEIRSFDGVPFVRTDLMAKAGAIVPLYDATPYPWNTVVKLKQTYTVGGEDHVFNCSGVMIGPFHVLTAGHCIFSYDPDGDKNEENTTPRWAVHVEVIPAQGDAVSPLGEEDWPYAFAQAVYLRSYTGWTHEHNHDHDWGVITLDRRLGDITSRMFLAWGDDAYSPILTGYPTEPKYGFEGNIFQYWGYPSDTDFSTYSIGLEIYGYGGQSGGPTWQTSEVNLLPYVYGVFSTSDRQGHCTETRVTENKVNGLNTWKAEDEVLRPPAPMPELHEFMLDRDNMKGLSSTNVPQGGMVFVEYNVLNSGSAGSGQITVDFYLSRDTEIKPWDTHIGTRVLPGLDVGQYHHETELVIVPPHVPVDAYHVGWIVSGSIPEYTTDNNAAVIGHQVLSVSDAGMEVLSPNGGEIWYVGETHPINWSSTGASNSIAIEISRNGETWSTIKGGTENDGIYDWTVTGPASEGYSALIRVVDILQPAIIDSNDSPFMIGEPFVEVTYPNFPTTITVGQVAGIRWQRGGFGSGLVKIELTRNAGSSWETLHHGTPNDGAFDWIAFGAESSACLLRITSTIDPSVTDLSDSLFAIELERGLQLTSPNGGESWSQDGIQSITWSSLNAGETVKIELSRNAGASWETIDQTIGNNDGHYFWLVTAPGSEISMIRVTSMDHPHVSDASDGFFTIEGHSIVVLQPQGGESWGLGETWPISWDSYNAGENVKIELLRDGGTSVEVLAASTPNDGLFNWTVTGPLSDACRIRIEMADNPLIYDLSNGDFSITDRSVNVTSPNGGEEWFDGEVLTATWISTGAGTNVQIDLSRNGGYSWEVIAPSTENDGSYSWTVGAPFSDNCIIRVTSTYTGVRDISDAPFSIAERSITITSPNGWGRWFVGDTANVTWSSRGAGFNVHNVQIDLSRDGGFSWEVVNGSTLNDGSQPWIVRGPASANCLIRVRSTSYPGVEDVSDAAFTIAERAINLSSPSGGEQWYEGEIQDITWISADAGAAVRLELSRDGGLGWEIIGDAVPNSGTHTWTVDVPGSADCRVRVISISYPTVTSTSPAPFTINEILAPDLIFLDGFETGDTSAWSTAVP